MRRRRRSLTDPGDPYLGFRGLSSDSTIHQRRYAGDALLYKVGGCSPELRGRLSSRSIQRPLLLREARIRVEFQVRIRLKAAVLYGLLRMGGVVEGTCQQHEGRKQGGAHEIQRNRVELEVRSLQT